MGVLFRVVTGFIPKLMAVIEALLSCGDVYLPGTEGGVGKNGHALGQDFDEAATDAVSLLTGLAAVEAYLAGAENGNQRSVSIENLKIAVPRWDLDGIRGFIDEDAIGGDEPDL
ncbi:MAG TPA: hypothetical protein VMB19_14095 [Silvibacterium sp.]|nr:hypothetical protein [Silvibacterium sp.]